MCIQIFINCMRHVFYGIKSFSYFVVYLMGFIVPFIDIMYLETLYIILTNIMYNYFSLELTY